MLLLALQGVLLLCNLAFDSTSLWLQQAFEDLTAAEALSVDLCGSWPSLLLIGPTQSCARSLACELMESSRDEPLSFTSLSCFVQRHFGNVLRFQQNMPGVVYITNEAQLLRVPLFERQGSIESYVLQDSCMVHQFLCN